MKQRIDVLLTERGLCESRERARSSIMSGLVYADGQRVDKPGQSVPSDCALELRGDPIGFVSRGGLKLEKALDVFGIDANGLQGLDAGASTGGFTDCLLKRGAKHVWAVDVGYGQLAWALRQDERVTVMERTNVRTLTPEVLGTHMDFCVMDLSFISLRLVLPVLRDVTRPGGFMAALIKPQFEAGRAYVGKNGVVRDTKVHLDVLRRFLTEAEGFGLSVLGMDYSPVKGPKGNIEFLAHLTVEAGKTRINDEDLVRLTNEAAAWGGGEKG